MEGAVPAAGAPGEAEEALFAAVDEKLAAITALHEAMEFRKAAAETRALWVIGNEYLTQAAPWTAIKTDPDRAALGVRIGLNLVQLFAEVAAPFVPDAASRILAAFGRTLQDAAWPAGPAAQLLDRLAPGRSVTAPEVLFRKIEDADIALWTERFGGG
jgi:methionyl-tRNA synthetase